MKYAWMQATVQIYARADGHMRPISARHPLRVRFDDEARFGVKIEIDRELSVPITRSGVKPEARFYLKSPEPLVTVSIPVTTVVAGHHVDIAR